MKLRQLLTFCTLICVAAVYPLAGQGTYIVNSTNDINDGVCNLTHCSLREAINAANSDGIPGTILFNFGNNCTPPCTIAVSTALPPLSSNLTIDALSGNGYVLGAVIIDGSAINGSASGFRIDSNIRIYGLQIQNFSACGITGTNSFITNVTIGTAGKGNILIQNGFSGIRFFTVDTLRVQGNYIGTNQAFAVNLGNGTYGIEMDNFTPASIEIGGTVTGQGNVICRNGNAGIKLNGNGNFNIRGNAIGTNPAGTASILGNANGIEIFGHTVGNVVIGGTGNAANQIAHHTGRGISVANGSNNVRISRNRIFCNPVAGIQLTGNANNSITPLTSANFTQLTPGQISGTGVNGNIIEVFKFDPEGCSTSGACQGKIFLGADTVSGGQWSIVPLVSLASGDRITATRTSGNNTSAFSVCQTVCVQPTAILSGGNPLVCKGDTADLFISAFGVPPFTIFYNVNGAQQIPFTVQSNSFIWQVSPSQTAVYQLTGISDAFCSGPAADSAIVFVKPIPGGTMQGGGNICQGGTAELYFSLYGTPPFTIFYTANGASQAPLNNIQDSLFIWKVSPTQTTVYQFIAVQDAACSGPAFGKDTVFVGQQPDGALLGGGNICQGGTAKLYFSLSGTTPFSVALHDGNTTINIDDIQNGHTLNVSPPVTGTTSFVLLNVTDANGCTRAVNDTVKVTTHLPPAVNAVDILCQDNFYDVNISVTSSLPLFSNGTPVQGNHVTMSSLPAGSSFSVLIGNTCGDTTIVSENNCFACFTSAGVFQSDTLKACEGTSIVAQHAGEILKAGDILVYVLTTSLPPSPDNVVAVSTGPEFIYTDALTLANPYFMSALAGKDSGSGMVTWDDPCLDIASGVTIIFNEKPEDVYWLQGEKTLCSGETLHLETVHFADPGTQYFWLLPNGDTIITTAPFLNRPVYGVEDTGKYYVLIHKGSCTSNPLGYHAVNVLHPDAAMSKAAEDFSVCEATATVSLNATPPMSGCKGKWYSLDEVPVSNSDSAAATASNLKPGANRFVWVVLCPGCGVVVMDTLTVIYEKPTVAADDFFVLKRIHETITMNVLLNDQLDQFNSFDEISVFYQDSIQGDLTWLEKEHAFHYKEPEGTFRGEVQFSYAVCRKNGVCPDACDTANVKINVLNLPKVPGGITPFNNDDFNNQLEIQGISGFESAEIIIVNRWGSIVFREKANNPDDTWPGWKGEYQRNGERLQEGAYFYVLKVRAGDESYEETGVVHVIDKVK